MNMIHLLFSTPIGTQDTSIFLIANVVDIDLEVFKKYVDLNVVGNPDFSSCVDGERIYYVADNDNFINRGIIYTTNSKKAYYDFLELFKNVLSVPPLDKRS